MSYGIETPRLSSLEFVELLGRSERSEISYAGLLEVTMGDYPPSLTGVLSELKLADFVIRNSQKAQSHCTVDCGDMCQGSGADIAVGYNPASYTDTTVSPCDVACGVDCVEVAYYCPVSGGFLATAVLLIN